MFRYFPTNYVWNLSVDLAIEMGARMGEIEEMCAPLQEAAKQPDAAGTKAFRETWQKMADKLCGLAEEDEANGRLLSAGEKYNRAATYYLTCERLQAHGAEGRAALYQTFLQTFARGIALSQENCERVEIPYEGAVISGLLVRAEGVSGPQPILVQVNGLDSTKEMKYRVGLPAWLAKRGVASLIIDQPGTGEALR
ncbi:MAG: alpha/beta hydrolase, partial [Pseudomonas sp.]